MENKNATAAATTTTITATAATAAIAATAQSAANNKQQTTSNKQPATNNRKRNRNHNNKNNKNSKHRNFSNHSNHNTATKKCMRDIYSPIINVDRINNRHFCPALMPFYTVTKAPMGVFSSKLQNRKKCINLSFFPVQNRRQANC